MNKAGSAKTFLVSTLAIAVISAAVMLATPQMTGTAHAKTTKVSAAANRSTVIYRYTRYSPATCQIG